MTKPDEKGKPMSTWTWTIKTPGKDYDWNYRKQQDLVNILALAEDGDGGTLTISYESDERAPSAGEVVDDQA